MKTLFLVCSMLLLAACSSHTIKCDGALRPINPPAPAAKKPVAIPAAAGVRAGRKP